MGSIEWKQAFRNHWVYGKNMLFEKEMNENRRIGFSPVHSGNLEGKAFQDIKWWKPNWGLGCESGEDKVFVGRILVSCMTEVFAKYLGIILSFPELPKSCKFCEFQELHPFFKLPKSYKTPFSIQKDYLNCTKEL